MGKYAIYGEEAERLYVKKGKSLKEISELLGVSVNSLLKWKDYAGWNYKRRKFLSTPRGVEEKLEAVLRAKVEELENMNPAEVSASVVDSLWKLLKSVESVRKERDLFAETVDVMDEFTSFLRWKVKDRDFLEKVFALINEFFEYVRRK